MIATVPTRGLRLFRLVGSAAGCCVAGRLFFEQVIFAALASNSRAESMRTRLGCLSGDGKDQFLPRFDLRYIIEECLSGDQFAAMARKLREFSENEKAALRWRHCLRKFDDLERSPAVPDLICHQHGERHNA